MELTCVRLLVDKFDECFLFYRDTLGFKPIFGSTGNVYAQFDAGKGFGIELFSISLMSAETGVSHLPAFVKQQDGCALSFKDEQIDRTYLELRGKGVTFLNEPHDIPAWGMRVVHFRDPSGNLIEINTNLQGASSS